MVFKSNYKIRYTSNDEVRFWSTLAAQDRAPAFVTNEFTTSRGADTKFNTDLQPGMSRGASLVLSTENAGGNSEKSEALSFEVLRTCFGAQLLKTEMEISYFGPGWKKTDFLVRIAKQQLGVSVTRAMKFGGTFTEDDAEHLLRKKLHGVNRSTLGVCDGDEWTQQILHVWSTDANVTDILRKVYVSERISDELRSNTIVLVTTAESADYVFFN